MKIPVRIECVLLTDYWRILYRNPVPSLLSHAGSTGRQLLGWIQAGSCGRGRRSVLMVPRCSDLPFISEVLIRAHTFHMYNNNDTCTNCVTQKRGRLLAVLEQILLAGTMETGDHE